MASTTTTTFVANMQFVVRLDGKLPSHCLMTQRLACSVCWKLSAFNLQVMCYLFWMGEGRRGYK